MCQVQIYLFILLQVINFVWTIFLFMLITIFFQVRELDDIANRLMQTHPDQAQSIYEHQKDINEAWNTLTAKADQRKAKLLDSYDFQRFLSDQR